MQTNSATDQLYLETMTKVYIATWLLPINLAVMYAVYCYATSVPGNIYAMHVSIASIVPFAMCVFFHGYIKTKCEYSRLPEAKKWKLEVFKKSTYETYLHQYLFYAKRFIAFWHPIRIFSFTK